MSSKKTMLSKPTYKVGGSTKKPLKKAQSGTQVSDPKEATYKRREAITKNLTTDGKDASERYVSYGKDKPGKVRKVDLIEGINSNYEDVTIKGKKIERPYGSGNDLLAAADMTNRMTNMITNSKTPNPSEMLGYKQKTYNPRLKTKTDSGIRYTDLTTKKTGGAVKSAPKMQRGGSTKSVSDMQQRGKESITKGTGKFTTGVQTYGPGYKGNPNSPKPFVGAAPAKKKGGAVKSKKK